MGIFEGFKKYIATDEDKVKDPVCGMGIIRNEDLKSSFEDKIFYFCSPTCKEKFEKNPTQILGY